MIGSLPMRRLPSTERLNASWLISDMGASVPVSVFMVWMAIRVFIL